MIAGSVRPLRLRRQSRGAWRVTLDNPPINLFDPELSDALQDLIVALEADPDVKVVIFDSADPEYFMAHVDIVRSAELDLSPGPTGLNPFPDFCRRLELAPFITVGVIRGRARGVGSEFIQALDVTFASRERAVLEHPEVPMGFIPGAGGMERLWRLIGRNRALEIICGGEDFDADLAERYGWINRAVPDDELDALVDRFVARVASFDGEALAAAKDVMRDHAGLAPVEQFGPTTARFFGLLARPEVQQRIAGLVDDGLQQRSDLEYDLGTRLGPDA